MSIVTFIEARDQDDELVYNRRVDESVADKKFEKVCAFFRAESKQTGESFKVCLYSNDLSKGNFAGLKCVRFEAI